MHAPLRPESAPHPGLGFREFVAIAAAVMAVNAASIDIMLPALPDIGASLGVADENARQWVITAYVLGFGVAQLFYGPIADRFGRRPVLLAGMVMFVVTCAIAAVAASFPLLLAARALQGVAAASTRVLIVSIVRDCYAGRAMARVMSLAFMVFLIIPVIAPGIGQLILYVAPWRWVFGALAIYGALVGVWCALRLPETLHPEYRRAIDPRSVLAATRIVLTDRNSLGYTLATTLLLGTLMGFIHSAQQIFTDAFHAREVFPLAFAAIAGGMAIGSFANSRIVLRLGSRRVGHAALLGVIACSATHVAMVIGGAETIWSFVLLQGTTMACFGLASSNFGAMAMESLGAVAGTASSVQGFLNTVGSALLGLVIGQSFDGTTLPVTLGFLGFGLLALACILATERGRLFGAHPPIAQ